VTSFEFTGPARVVFGPGALAEAGPAAAGMGKKALVVVGSQAARAEALLKGLSANGVDFVIMTVSGEPDFETARQAAALIKAAACELAVGFGGGSVMDAAKAAAALSTNGGDPLDYAEVIGAGRAFKKPSLPTILIPTTAGSGSEATRNAVLSSPREKVKVSLRGAPLLARLALVDPCLTLGLPPALTASTGMDALTQLVEPFVSQRANPVADLWCREGMRRCARSLRRACR
jgi:alcohol dehydrogenase class IV